MARAGTWALGFFSHLHSLPHVLFHIVDNSVISALTLAEAAKNDHQTVLFIHARRVFVAGFDNVTTRLLDAPSEGAQVQTVQWVVLKIVAIFSYGLVVIVSPK